MSDRMLLLGAACLSLIAVGGADGSQLPKLRVSDNQRFLVKDDGTAFIWIGDTIWDFQQLTPEQLDEYLDVRASQGYTVIQTQIASYGTESFRKNFRGDWCFAGPLRKDITQPQEAWFQHADAWLDKIEQRGLYAALGLGWIINYWHLYDKAGDPAKRFSEEDFYNYGKWIGNRYKDRSNIIWLGLNESTYATTPVDKVKAVCRGIRDGDTGDKLLTLHPQAGTRTSDLFGDFVDFNSWQTARFLAPKNLPFWRSVPGVDDKLSGALVKNTFTVWEAIADDYNRTPVKPVIDLEAWYEGAVDDMPVGRTDTRATAWHCRQRAYFTIFAGSFGHTYGADSLAWQIKGDGWRKGLHLPGGKHVGHIAKLLGEPQRPFLKLVPDQGLITAGQSQSYDSHKQAARAGDGSYAYVYSANGSDFSVDLRRLGSDRTRISALWFDPREAVYQPAGGPYHRVPSQAFDPPGSPAVDNDWVLVLSASPTYSWKCFLRGLPPVFMDDPPVDGAVKHPNFTETGPDSPAARTRAAVGDTLRFASRMELAEILPTNDAALCSTRYCLRNPGKEYLVYNPGRGSRRSSTGANRDGQQVPRGFRATIHTRRHLVHFL